MRSNWTTEILAIVRKEVRSEIRTKAGLMASGLFSAVAVVALALAAYRQRLEPSMAAGLIWVSLLFASAIAIPRSFTLEEEQGTGDLLRLWARPHAVFWGKALYNLGQMFVTALVVTVLFLGLTDRTEAVTNPGQLAVALFGGCVALAGTGTLCGAIVAQAKNRSALAGALALPLLLPLVFLAVEALRIPLGGGDPANGWRGAFGLVAYGVATFAIGPYLYAAIWKS